ncbi:MAG: protein kinase [Planctomycetota bacterium]
MSDAIPNVLGPYRVERELGRGGMGVVYLGVDPRLDRQVAIKMLPAKVSQDAERLARFEREAKTLAALNHPNLAGVYGLHEHEGQQLLVMEYVPGLTLTDRIEAETVPVDEAVGICMQVAAGLEAAHDQNVIHRDIKPANIRIRPDGAVKLLDFGLAKPDAGPFASTGDDDETLSIAGTAMGRVLGTAGYMSPEQARGKPVDKRTDIWAFGCVLFECLAGSRAFGGETPMDAIVAVLEREPPWSRLPPQTPERVIDLIQRCLEKDDKRRLRDIGDARIELDDALRRLSHNEDAMPARGPRQLGGKRRTGSGSGFQRGSGSGAHPSVFGIGFGTSTSGMVLGNLPAPVTSFIGRTEEVETVSTLLDRSRLVTLAGSGGCGKTRLALEVARGRAEFYDDGVWLIDLAGINDSSTVGETVAAALGLGEARDRRPLDLLCETLADRAPLLILDNCEHVLEGCRALVGQLLTACPGLVMIATSREALGVPGEALFRVPSLRMPSADQIDDLKALARNESVTLFLDRARAAKPAFELDTGNAAEVVAICRELDGIPLAIELAAARVKLLTPGQIAERLKDRFKLLRGNSGVSLPRQQTLLAAIEWSYENLEDIERIVLRRLSTFRGGMTISAAEHVAAADGTDDGAIPTIEDWEVLELIAQLVDKSMLIVEDTADTGPSGKSQPNQPRETRYRMLESIRQYAAERLDESGETSDCRDRHLEWHAKLANRAEPRLTGPDQRAWLHRLEVEHEDIRTAVDWVLDGEGDLELGRQVAGGVWRYWAYRGHIAEGRKLLARLDAAGQGGSPTASWARIREGMSWIAMMVGDLGTAVSFGRAGLEIARASKDDAATANLLQCLGQACLGERLATRALDYFEEALAISRRLNKHTTVAAVLYAIAESHRQLGGLDRAETEYNEVTAIIERQGEVLLAAQAEAGRAWVALARGETSTARDRARSAIEMAVGVGALAELPGLLELLASVLAAEDQFEAAARLIGAARNARRALACPLRPSAEDDLAPAIEKLAEAEDQDAVEAAMEEGERLKLRKAIREALDQARAEPAG